MNEIDVALEAGRAAATLIRASGGPARVSHKGRINLVTEVDLACEAAVREVLGRHTPDIPVLGEEGGGAEGAVVRWVVDPLDGTTNFVHGFPMVAVSIALEVDGCAQVGVVLDVYRGLEYSAERGGGAWCDGTRLAVSECGCLEHALVGTGFPYDRLERAHVYLRYVDAVLRRTQGVRRAGACALDLAMVAAGALDAFWEFGLCHWDVIAGGLLVEEAGGRVSAHDGGGLRVDRVHPLATNGRLHESMIALLAEVTARQEREPS